MSSAAVVAASRAWVCIRATTYEDEGEYLYFNRLYNQAPTWGPDRRAGKLPNTFCALFAADGVQRLTRIGRHPEFLLDTIRESGHPAGTSGSPTQRFADLLDFLFDEHAARRPGTARPLATLPVALDFRRALNVAACDNRPLVVALAQDPERLRDLERQLAELAWGPEFVGRLTYALVADRVELQEVSGVEGDEGVFVIEPGPFGLEGEVIASWPGTGGAAGELVDSIRAGLERYARARRERAAHVRAGLEAGAAWEPAVHKDTVVPDGAASGGARPSVGEETEGR